MFLKSLPWYHTLYVPHIHDNIVYQVIIHWTQEELAEGGKEKEEK